MTIVSLSMWSSICLTYEFDNDNEEVTCLFNAATFMSYLYLPLGIYVLPMNAR